MSTTGDPDAARLAALADDFARHLRGLEAERAAVGDTPLPWTSHYAAWSIAVGLSADLAQRVRTEVMCRRAVR